ncbi:hypothetical protein DL93DRAFT_2234350 [Clavulina sp. PMI_390]|nr:hypothetical protein DL93DRAFT_2234350 [Clavulina sp. PMI_390]
MLKRTRSSTSLPLPRTSPRVLSTSVAGVWMQRRPAYISSDHDGTSREPMSAPCSIDPVVVLQSLADACGSGFAVPGSLLCSFSFRPHPLVPGLRPPTTPPLLQQDAVGTDPCCNTLVPPHLQVGSLGDVRTVQGICSPFLAASSLNRYQRGAHTTPWLGSAMEDVRTPSSDWHHTMTSAAPIERYLTSGETASSYTPTPGMPTSRYPGIQRPHGSFLHLSLQQHVQAGSLVISDSPLSARSLSGPNSPCGPHLLARPQPVSFTTETFEQHSSLPTDDSFQRLGTTTGELLETPPLAESSDSRIYGGKGRFIELAFDTATSSSNPLAQTWKFAPPSAENDLPPITIDFGQSYSRTEGPPVGTPRTQPPNSKRSSAFPWPQAGYHTTTPLTTSSPRQSTSFADTRLINTHRLNRITAYQASLAQNGRITSTSPASRESHTTSVPNGTDPLVKAMSPSLQSSMPNFRLQSSPEQDEDGRNCKRIKRDGSSTDLGPSCRNTGLKSTSPKPGVGQVHSLDGCWRCRQRGKKCPIQRDERGWCSECVRLGLDCPGGYGKPRPSGSGSRRTRSENSRKYKVRRVRRAVEQTATANSMTTHIGPAPSIPPILHLGMPLDATPPHSHRQFVDLDPASPFSSLDVNPLEPPSLSIHRSPVSRSTPISSSRHATMRLAAPGSAPLPSTVVAGPRTNKLFVLPASQEEESLGSGSALQSIPNPSHHSTRPAAPLLTFEMPSPSSAGPASEGGESSRGSARVNDFLDMEHWFQDLNAFD